MPAPAPALDTFGRSIREARLARQLSQAQLAEQLGCGQSYLSDLERGTSIPSVHMVARMAVLLGLDEGDLVRSAAARAPSTATPSPAQV